MFRFLIFLLLCLSVIAQPQDSQGDNETQRLGEDASPPQSQNESTDPLIRPPALPTFQEAFERIQGMQREVEAVMPGANARPEETVARLNEIIAEHVRLTTLYPGLYFQRRAHYLQDNLNTVQRLLGEQRSASSSPLFSSSQGFGGSGSLRF